jgi:hypothetical protein
MDRNDPNFNVRTPVRGLYRKPIFIGHNSIRPGQNNQESESPISITGVNQTITQLDFDSDTHQSNGVTEALHVEETDEQKRVREKLERDLQQMRKQQMQEAREQKIRDQRQLQELAEKTNNELKEMKMKLARAEEERERTAVWENIVSEIADDTIREDVLKYLKDTSAVPGDLVSLEWTSLRTFYVANMTTIVSTQVVEEREGKKKKTKYVDVDTPFDSIVVNTVTNILYRGLQAYKKYVSGTTQAHTTTPTQQNFSHKSLEHHVVNREKKISSLVKDPLFHTMTRVENKWAAIKWLIQFETACKIRCPNENLDFYLELLSRCTTNEIVALSIVEIRRDAEQNQILNWSEVRTAVLNAMIPIALDELGDLVNHYKFQNESWVISERTFWLLAELKYASMMQYQSVSSIDDLENTSGIDLISLFSRKVDAKVKEWISGIKSQYVKEKETPHLREVLQIMHESYSFTETDQYNTVAKRYYGVSHEQKHKPKLEQPKGVGKPSKMREEYGKGRTPDNKVKVGQPHGGSSNGSQERKHCFKCGSTSHVDQFKCTNTDKENYYYKFAPQKVRERVLNGTTLKKEVFESLVRNGKITDSNKPVKKYSAATIRLKSNDLTSVDLQMLEALKALLMEVASDRYNPVPNKLKDGTPTIISKTAAVNTIELSNSCVVKQAGKGMLVPNIRPLRVIDAIVQGTKVRALVDSGAQVSVISKPVVDRLREQSQFDEEQNALLLEFADGSTENCDTVGLSVQLDNRKLDQVVFAVMKRTSELYDCIFGLDLICDFDISIPYLSREVVHSLKSGFELPSIEKIVDEQARVALEGLIFHSRMEELVQLLSKELEANADTDSKHSTLGEICINFIDERNRKLGSWTRQMKIPVAAEEEVKKIIAKWIDEGIIEPMIDLQSHQDIGDQGVGPFNTNGFLTFSGKWRFVHNFKPINSLIEDDTNDVPSIDYVFDQIAKSEAVIFSRIDLRSAYLQIPLRRQDRNITAFTVWNKRFRFVTAPLGLKHIPSVFQRMIKAKLQEKDCADFATNFIDDIIIYSASIEEHVEHVKRVLNALTEVNLTIQRSKCHFFCERIPLLGYWVSKNGIEPNIDKLCNMMQWKRPSTPVEVQKYLGLINFFRRFIGNASKVERPIRDLAKLDPKTKFNWGDYPDCEKAYKQLFDILVNSKAFLSFPVKGVPLELATDASNLGISAVVFQTINGVKKYIGFHSRVLSESESRYSVPKKELLSIIAHCNHYRDILIGRMFKLHTDAQSLEKLLKSLEKQAPKDSSLINWVSQLAEYDFEVHHIAGVNNFLPDVASRVNSVSVPDPIEHARQVANKFATEKLTLDTDLEVEQYVNETVDLIAAVNALESSDEKTAKEKISKQVDALLEEFHAIGHFGSNSMFRQIQLVLKNTPNDLLLRCQNYVKNCAACTRVNKGKSGFAARIAPRYTVSMQDVHMDLMEMPKSLKGHEYILTMVDKFSGFIWLKPLISKEMDEVTRNVMEIFLLFGFPKTIKTDKGSEFVNSLISHVCNVCKIQHNVIIPDNHEAQGRIEKQHVTIRITLKKKVIEQRMEARREAVANSVDGALEDQALDAKLFNLYHSLEGIDFNNTAWHELVPGVAFALNSRVHATTLTTPFDLMFGRSPIRGTVATDIAMADTSKGELSGDVDENREVVVRFWDLFNRCVPDAVLKIITKKFEQQKYHHTVQKIMDGDHVMYRNPNCGKNTVSLDGPFEVVKPDSINGQYVLRSPGNPDGFVAPSQWLTKVADQSMPLTTKPYNMEAKMLLTSLMPEVDPDASFEVGRDDLDDSDYVNNEDDIANDLVIEKPSKKKSYKSKEAERVVKHTPTPMLSRKDRKRKREETKQSKSFIKSKSDGERKSQRRKKTPKSLHDYDVKIRGISVVELPATD